MVRTRGALSARTRGALKDMHHVTPGGDPVIVRQPHRVYDLDEHVRPFVIASEFYEISRIRGINLDHGLILALLERWSRETHTFHLRVGEMTPTFQDVAMLTDLPIDGVPVIGPGGPFDLDELCLHLLGRVFPRIACQGDSLKMTWLESEFQTLPDKAMEDQLIMYARAYIMYLLGGVIFTSSAGNVVPVYYLTLLEEFWLVHTYSWGRGHACILVPVVM
ncbi:protein MAIN-LIKE 2-like [Actinidia eriantha]|uniref:protein MAIN-LIKE 2-like n=1 Tax=Actinidia eriantha TaxID=165200 RepID=UPI00258ACBE4|nr:protein MAIN-LIKE 2-like [Actinidia eriantha]